MEDRTADWQGYVAFCQEMHAFDAGAFYATTAGGVQLWQDRRYWHVAGRGAMEPYIQRAFPDMHATMTTQLVKFGWPLTSHIVDTLASSTSEIMEVRPIDPVTRRELRKVGPNKEETAHAAFLRRWPSILAASGMPESLSQVERWRELDHSAFLVFRIVEGEVIADPLPTYVTHIEPHPLVPRRLDWARSISIPLAGAAYADAEGMERIRFRREQPEDVTVGASRWQVEELEEDGSWSPLRLAGMSSADGINTLGFHPIVGFHTRQPAGVRCEPDWSLHDEQIGLNLLEIKLIQGFTQAAHRQGWIKGMEPTLNDASGRIEQPTLPNGTHAWWNLPQDAEAGAVEARVAVQELMAVLEKFLKLSAVARNLPPSSVDLNRQPSNNTGHARQIERSDLELRKQRREHRLALEVERAFGMWAKVWNVVHPPGDPDRIPDGVAFKVLFHSVPTNDLDQSSVQALQGASALGAASLAREVMHRERLADMGEALSVVKSYAKEVAAERTAVTESQGNPPPE